MNRIERQHRKARLARLVAAGFDRTTREAGVLSVGCSQCAALVINGVACHEAGCPHQVFKCKGCNATVNRRGGYCEDCR